MKTITVLLTAKGRTVILALLCALGGFHSAFSQSNTLAINLETVLQLGGANNLTIQEYKQRQALAGADLAKAREWWLPDLFAGISMHQLWGSSMNGDGRFFTDVNRQNFWGGLSLNVTWDFGDGIYDTKAANLKAQAATYLTQAERNKALLQAIEAYYDLVSAQLFFKAYGQLALQADTIVKQIDVQVQGGLRYESELLLAKSNYSHLRVEMLNSKMSYANASARLVNLLNLEPSVQLVVTDSLLAPIELVSEAESFAILDTAYQNRPELKGIDLIIQSLEKEKQSVTTGMLLPELYLGVNGSYFGDVFSPAYPTGEINGALLWRIPIGRITYAGELKQFNSRISIRQNELAQLKNRVSEEVANARASVSVAKQQMEIAKEGNAYAAQALEQSLQRQQLGTIRPFEILQAQEVYMKARLDYLKAVSAYNKAQYGLFVAMGYGL